MNRAQLLAWLFVLISALVAVIFALSKNTKILNIMGYVILYSVALFVIYKLKLMSSEVGISRQAVYSGIRVALPFMIAIIISGIFLFYFKKNFFLI